ncbi:hypothetical protein [Kitasatospora sp. NPDC056531]
MAREDAELAAGALVCAIDLLIDELFEDIENLAYTAPASPSATA